MAVLAGRFELVEEPALAASPIVLLGLARLDRPRQHAQELTAQQIGLAGVEAIEGARPDQCLGAAGPHVPGGDALEEVVQALKRALELARLDDRLDGLESNPLDRSQAEVDLALAGDPEIDLPLVDIRQQDLDLHPTAVVDMFNKKLVPLGAVHLRREHGRHELGRVVRLQVSGLKGDQGVSRAMRFVEAVAAEMDDQVEDLGGLVPVQTLLDRSLDELVAALGDIRRLFSSKSP